MPSAKTRRSRCESIMLSIAVCLTLALASREEARAAEVKYLRTEITRSDDETIIARGAFEITGPPNRWYTVYFQVRLDAANTLKLKDEKGEKDFVRSWGEIFTPENVETARYGDCRLGFATKEVAAATNLPMGKRTILWVVCDVWADADGKYIGSGWDVRAPLVVTTDNAGKIVKLETFNTSPLAPKKNDPAAKINVKESELSLKHLKIKPGARLYRGVGGKHETYDILVMDDSQANLASLNRGFFFEAIDSPEKAGELVEIGYPGAVIVKTGGQYRGIVNALKAKGWQPGKHIKVDEPPYYGVSVTDEPQLGYRVQMLMIDYVSYYDLGLRNVVHREFAVAPDGRIGIAKETECILAPESETGAPPGWTQPLPMEPKGYNQTLRPVLTADGSQNVPRVTVTDKKVAIPCAEGEDPRWYLSNYEDWPEDASQ